MQLISLKLQTQDLKKLFNKHSHHLIAVIALALWCYPYLSTGTKLLLGDFSFFCQGYEAIRISLLQYHQFPWFNPWVSGGDPLYANPQFGVFSIQTIFVLLWGAPIGLKVAIAAYTIAGYFAMFTLLRRYFKVEALASTLLSILWITCTFFVAHLPSHFTFVWYMVAPYYLYLALTLKTRRSGVIFGLLYAIMGLAQIHNAFMHITLLCGIIFAVRLFREKNARKQILVAIAIAVAIFVALAGHRAIFTLQNVHEFPRAVSDPTPNPISATLGILLPLSMARPIHTFNYPQPPAIAHGYHEVTATIGIGALLAFVFIVFHLAHEFYISNTTSQRKKTIKRYAVALILLGIALVLYITALGKVLPFAPYALLKHLPVFSEMRVSTRWFLFFDLAILCLIGAMVTQAAKRSSLKFTIYILLGLGVVEMLALNVGYQAEEFASPAVVAPLESKSYPFAQTSYFGQTRKLPGGGEIPDDGNMPARYREYEATTYNLGILYANDALIQLDLDPGRNAGHPTCPWEEGCGLVKSHNAVVTEWSPGRIVFKRTAPGPIDLNMNASSYFTVNGVRNTYLRVAEPYQDFIVDKEGNQSTITIEVKPSLISMLTKRLHANE